MFKKTLLALIYSLSPVIAFAQGPTDFEYRGDCGDAVYCAASFRTEGDKKIMNIKVLKSSVDKTVLCSHEIALLPYQGAHDVFVSEATSETIMFDKRGYLHVNNISACSPLISSVELSPLGD